VESSVISKLQAMFQLQLHKVCKGFVKQPERPFKTKDILYRRDLRNGVTAFLLLMVAPRDDRFTLEVAWSLDGSFPVNMLCRLPFGNPSTGTRPDAPLNGQMRFRISEFWNPGRDDWWYLAGSKPDLRKSIDDFINTDWSKEPTITYSDQQVSASIDAAIAAIKQYVLPYFDNLGRLPREQLLHG